jgi:hypothetical protein
MWNDLVKVIKYDKVSQEDKDHARLLLGQLNTAGGIHLIRKEVTYFLEDMYEKYGNIPKITLEQELINLKNDYNKYKTNPHKGYAKLDGMRYYNTHETICNEYEMRIQELERKIKTFSEK